MEIITYVNKNGTQEGDCDFRTIELCSEDEKSLFVILGHSLSGMNKFKKVHILEEDDYQKFIKFRDTHPDYINYTKAIQVIKEFENKYKMM